MRNIIFKACIALLAISVSACGLIRDRSGEYAGALPGKALTVPEGYSDLKIGARYPIPPIETKKSIVQEGYELPKPPSATAALSKAPYVVESLENLNWLSLFAPPGKIWPLLDFYWQENGVKLDQQRIQQGVVLTQAIPVSSPLAKIVDGSSVMPVSIYARLVQGVRRNTSELHVRLVPPGLELNDSAWGSAISDSAIETDLLNDIGRFVTSEASRNRHSLLANDINGEPRVFMKEDAQGEQYLQLNLSFLRAWSEVGKALKASEVLVSDVDQSKKKYYVSYLDKEALDSWFISEAQKADKAMERNFEISVDAANADQDDVYEVRVKIMNDAFEPATVNELLTAIFEHIS